MSYVPSDFDNLNPGFNILNIYETSTDLSSIEGEYTDKGLGYKQQYSLYGALNNALDPSNPQESHITMDFCMIVKGRFTPSATCKLITYIGDDFISEQPQYVSQQIDLVNIQTYTQMYDSDGNLVVLVEGFDLSAMDEIRDLNTNSHFCMYVRQTADINIVNITSFGRDGFGSLTPPTPDQQSLVLKWIAETNITNFSIARKSNISDIMEVSFEGTFDNSYLGTKNNSLTFMNIAYVNPRTYQDVSKTLVEGTDFTVSGNTFYSGTGSSASTIDIDLGEMFPEGINFNLFIATDVNWKVERQSTFENLPVFNWGKDGSTKFFNVNGEYRINDEPLLTRIMNNIYPVGTVYMTNISSFDPNNPSNNFVGTWTQLTGDAYLKIVASNGGNYGGTSSEHKIPISSMPSHNHSITSDGSHSHTYTVRYNYDYSHGHYNATNELAEGADKSNGTYTATWSGGGHSHTISNTGGGNAYYPYYYGVYVWIRTA